MLIYHWGRQQEFRYGSRDEYLLVPAWLAQGSATLELVACKVFKPQHMANMLGTSADLSRPMPSYPMCCCMKLWNAWGRTWFGLFHPQHSGYIQQVTLLNGVAHAALERRGSNTVWAFTTPTHGHRTYGKYSICGLLVHRIAWALAFPNNGTGSSGAHGVEHSLGFCNPEYTARSPWQSSSMQGHMQSWCPWRFRLLPSMRRHRKLWNAWDRTRFGLLQSQALSPCSSMVRLIGAAAQGCTMVFLSHMATVDAPLLYRGSGSAWLIHVGSVWFGSVNCSRHLRC